MDYKTDNYRFDKDGNVAGWDEIRTFKVEVRNTRNIHAKVEIRRNFHTPYWELEKSGGVDEFEKVDVDTVKFMLDLQPRCAKEFEYVLTTYHGIRQEDYAKRHR
jgi:hypothetical protein